MFNYECEMVTCKNTKAADKPNEDLVVFEKNKNAGLLIDGVSRDRENGVYPNPSPAEVASKIFANSVIGACSKSQLSGIAKLQYIIGEANEKVKRYNNELGHRFPAGTVGIVFSLEQGFLNYGYIGDCYAALIRNGMQRIFTECQTFMVTKHKKDFTSDEIRFEICNNISHPCGYGVWNGSPKAMDFTKYGSIRLSLGDVILIYSDGLEPELREKTADALAERSLDQLFDVGIGENKDDKSCLRIRVCERFFDEKARDIRK